MIFSRKQTGDTIVEVLIAIVVLASVLTGAYTSASRSFNTTNRNRERDTGVRVAQEQIELIRPALADTSVDVAGATKTFCLTIIDKDSDGEVDDIKLTENNTLTYVDPSDPITASDYSAECIVDADGKQYVAGTSKSIPFYVATKKTGDLYKVNIRWDRSGGGQTQQAELIYRVYP